MTTIPTKYHTREVILWVEFAMLDLCARSNRKSENVQKRKRRFLYREAL